MQEHHSLPRRRGRGRLVGILSAVRKEARSPICQINLLQGRSEHTETVAGQVEYHHHHQWTCANPEFEEAKLPHQN